MFQFYPQMLGVADQLIQQFGMQANLVRPNGSPASRSCWVVIYDYEPRDRSTQLANPTERKVIIAAGLGGVVTVPPDNEQDQLQVLTGPDAGVSLPFTSPVKIYAPAGIVIAYESTVRR